MHVDALTSVASFGSRTSVLFPNKAATLWPGPDKFYKGGSQEETLFLRPELFLLPSPGDRTRSVPTSRAMESGAGHCSPSGLGFLYQRFSSTVRDEASQF